LLYAMTQKEAALLRKWIDFMYINIIRVSAAFTEVEGRIYIKYRSKEAAESMPEVYGEGEGPNLDNRIQDVPSAWSVLPNTSSKWTLTKTLSDLRVCTHSTNNKKHMTHGSTYTLRLALTTCAGCSFEPFRYILYILPSRHKNIPHSMAFQFPLQPT
jgi:hypothetical protein